MSAGAAAAGSCARSWSDHAFISSRSLAVCSRRTCIAGLEKYRCVLATSKWRRGAASITSGSESLVSSLSACDTDESAARDVGAASRSSRSWATVGSCCMPSRVPVWLSRSAATGAPILGLSASVGSMARDSSRTSTISRAALRTKAATPSEPDGLLFLR
eukprot:scaffold47745_cov68-Phaeocystis_antarctica.AAC.6